MAEFTINKEFSDRFYTQITKQIRYAAAVALTKTAQDCQRELIRRLPESFTIRSGWVARGIRIRPADKTNLVAKVLDLDAFMALQASGGTKDVGPSGKAMGIPVSARSTPMTQLLRGRNWPGDLLHKHGFFMAPVHGGAMEKHVKGQSQSMSSVKIRQTDVGKMGLFYRPTPRRYPIVLMYVFKREVHLQKRFHFFEIIRQKAHEVMQKNFDEALKQAVATMR